MIPCCSFVIHPLLLSSLSLLHYSTQTPRPSVFPTSRRGVVVGFSSIVTPLLHATLAID